MLYYIGAYVQFIITEQKVSFVKKVKIIREMSILKDFILSIETEMLHLYSICIALCKQICNAKTLKNKIKRTI